MIYISMGWNCAPAITRKAIFHQSKEKGYKTCPFDLCVTPYKSLLNCLQTDFSDFFQLRIENGIIMNAYNMWFNHEAPMELYSTDNFKLFIERYSKRISNFKEYLNGNYEVCFIHSDPFHSSVELCNIIKQKYPNLIFKIISVHYADKNVYLNHFSKISDCKTHAKMGESINFESNDLILSNCCAEIFNCFKETDLNTFIRIQNTFTLLDLKSPNFGDGITEYLFNGLSNKNLTYIGEDLIFNTYHYVPVGSILSLTSDKSIILGAGFLDQFDNLGNSPDNTKSNTIRQHPFYVLSSRGPKTQKKIMQMGEIKCNKIFGDPVLLFPLVHAGDIIEKKQIGVIAHYIDRDSELYTKFINILNNLFPNSFYEINILMSKENTYMNIIDKVVSCDIIISSSLHGLVLGVSYGKKVIFTQFEKLSLFKFNDFFQSIGVHNYQPLQYDSVDFFNNYIEYERKTISNLGSQLLKLYHFIDIDRKKYLLDQWSKIWSS